MRQLEMFHFLAVERQQDRDERLARSVAGELFEIMVAVGLLKLR